MSSVYTVEKSKLDAIANAIQLKRDITTGMTIDDMPLQIGLIEGGSGLKIKKFDVEFTTKSYAQTITHDLGVLPLVIYARYKGDATDSLLWFYSIWFRDSISGIARIPNFENMSIEMENVRLPKILEGTSVAGGNSCNTTQFQTNGTRKNYIGTYEVFCIYE